MADSDAVFGDASGNSHNVNFLEGIISNEVPGYLSGEAYQGNTVIIGSCKTCHQIGSAGAAGYQTHADLAGGAGIGVRFVNKSLFMSWKYDFYITVFIQFIANVNGAGARIAKQHFNAFFL